MPPPGQKRGVSPGCLPLRSRGGTAKPAVTTDRVPGAIPGGCKHRRCRWPHSGELSAPVCAGLFIGGMTGGGAGQLFKEVQLNQLQPDVAEKVAAMSEYERESFWQLAGRLQYEDGYPQEVADSIALTETYRRPE